LDDRREREVARGLRKGRTEAWQALYDAYAERVWCSVARRMGGQSADVADVVQETFLAAARSAPTFDPDRGSLWLWLSGIARKHVALYYRKRKRHDRLPRADDWPAVDGRQVLRWLEGREAAPADALLTAELAGAVRHTLARLPVEYETLLVAKYLDGVTAEQLAQAEGSTSTAIRSKLARARRAFRRAFGKTSPNSVDSRASGHDES
jgi:RNA polymerase sigma-70 factor (ECF subfamily)